MKYQVEKSIVIHSDLASVRQWVADFNAWSCWSPWNVLEPGCPVTLVGEPAEIGHSMEWDGQVIGAGKNTLSHVNDTELVNALEFYRPWKGKATATFKFEALGTDESPQTQVTWTLDASLPFFLFFMVKMMKNWVGMDYERGLKMLKAMIEEGSIGCETLNEGITDYQGFSYKGIQRTCTIDEMPEQMKKDFEKLVDDIVIKGGKQAMHWVTIYPKFDIKNGIATYIAAVSDENLADISLDSSYVSGSIKSSQAYEIKHNGTYEMLGNAWSMGMMNLQAKKLKGSGYPFEQYWNSPAEVEPKDLKTSIYFPVKG